MSAIVAARVRRYDSESIPTSLEMHINAHTRAVVAVAIAAGAASPVALAQAKAGSTDQVKRGEYLVGFGGCHDCHSPKSMTSNGPAPDSTRLLSGHRADAKLPPVPAGAIGPGQWGAITNNDLTAWAGPWGISFAANLTPDKNTGLGAWSASQFVQTMRTGKHLGVGRAVLPPMPWQDLAVLTDQDLTAIFAYLMSLKPIENRVPQPIAPK